MAADSFSDTLISLVIAWFFYLLIIYPLPPPHEASELSKPRQTAVRRAHIHIAFGDPTILCPTAKKQQINLDLSEMLVFNAKKHNYINIKC